MRSETLNSSIALFGLIFCPERGEGELKPAYKQFELLTVSEHIANDHVLICPTKKSSCFLAFRFQYLPPQSLSFGSIIVRGVLHLGPRPLENAFVIGRKPFVRHKLCNQTDENVSQLRFNGWPLCNTKQLQIVYIIMDPQYVQIIGSIIGAFGTIAAALITRKGKGGKERNLIVSVIVGIILIVLAEWITYYFIVDKIGAHAYLRRAVKAEEGFLNDTERALVTYPGRDSTEIETGVIIYANSISNTLRSYQDQLANGVAVFSGLTQATEWTNAWDLATKVQLQVLDPALNGIRTNENPIVIKSNMVNSLRQIL